MQIYGAEDLSKSVGSGSATELLDVPCTCTLQFLARDGYLHLIAHMRSNDAYLGLPHDVFCFTMMQELMARALNLQLGSYTHSVGSLHIYEHKRDAAERYLLEGWHQASDMPPMPDGDQMPNVLTLIEIEQQIRRKLDGSGSEALPGYWKDLATLLLTHARLEQSDPQRHSQILSEAREHLSCGVYKQYLRDLESGSVEALDHER